MLIELRDKTGSREDKTRNRGYKADDVIFVSTSIRYKKDSDNICSNFQTAVKEISKTVGTFT